MRFRTDIDPHNTWVVSDTHFHHGNISAFCHRPPEHDQVIIAEWRKEVPDDAVVVHLGDLNYGNNARFKHLVSKELTGKKKYLIRWANHDRQSDGFYKKSGFFPIEPFKIFFGARRLDFEGADRLEDHIGRVRFDNEWWDRLPYVVSFSHYPWNDAEDGGPQPDNHIRLHGHIHNNGYTRQGYVPFLRNHINLSVEQTKYKPVNLGLLLDAALLGKFEPTTEEQLDEVRRKRKENYATKKNT